MWIYMATVSSLNMHVVTSHGAIHPKTKTMQFHYDVKPYTINQSLLVISLLPLMILGGELKMFTSLFHVEGLIRVYLTCEVYLFNRIFSFVHVH